MSPTRHEARLASDLRMVVAQLVRRLRAERRFSLSQGSVLGHLDREGPCGISELAAAERVRPQSMAQTVRDLEGDGLVGRRPHPDDGRRVLIELTPAGRSALEAERRTREGAIAAAIAHDLTPAEQDTLRDAIPILRRLADGADH